MYFSSVKEIEQGPCPTINSNSLKVYDPIKQILYVYGGTRWPGNQNSRSPTNRPTSDFYAFRSYPCPRWDNYTTHMRQDEAFISPFEETLAGPERLNLALPKLGSLPALENCCGAIAHDKTASRTRYLLILGDPVGRENKKLNHPILLCINLQLNTWRYIRLKNAENFPRGRSRASMIVVGELRAADSAVLLCLFGGVNEDSNLDSIKYLDTFAIANLTKATWIIPNGRVPRDIGPLGIHPGLTKYQCQHTGREIVIVLRGAVEEPSAQGNSTAKAKVDFSKAYQFDPQRKANQFSELGIDRPSRHPRLARSFLLQSLQTTNEYCDEFLVVTCGRQRPLNKFPGIPTDPDETGHIYVRPDVEVWIMTMQEPDEEARSASCETSDGQEMDSTSEHPSSEDESSDSSRDSKLISRFQKTHQGPLGMLAQRAIRSGTAIVQKSKNSLKWRNITGGKIKQSLRNLSHSFRVEAMLLTGELSTQFDPLDISENHSMSPNLILLGSDHEFLGEIRVDIFNAFARTSLRSLPETEDDELEDQSIEENTGRTVSTRSTPIFSATPDDIIFYDEDEPDANSSHESIGETSSDEVHEMVQEKMSSQLGLNETWLELVADEQLDPSLIRRPDSSDPFLLSPESDLMDIEIENIMNHATEDDTALRSVVLPVLGIEGDEDLEIQREYTYEGDVLMAE